MEKRVDAFSVKVVGTGIVPPALRQALRALEVRVLNFLHRSGCYDAIEQFLCDRGLRLIGLLSRSEDKPIRILEGNLSRRG